MALNTTKFIDPLTCVKSSTSLDCPSAGLLVATMVDKLPPPYSTVFEFYINGSCFTLPAGENEDPHVGPVIQHFHDWRYGGEGQHSDTIKELIELVGTRCTEQFCKNLHFSGNPDFAGIGVIVALVIQISITTLFISYYGYNIYKQFRSLALHPALHSASPALHTSLPSSHSRSPSLQASSSTSRPPSPSLRPPSPSFRPPSPSSSISAPPPIISPATLSTQTPALHSRPAGGATWTMSAHRQSVFKIFISSCIYFSIGLAIAVPVTMTSTGNSEYTARLASLGFVVALSSTVALLPLNDHCVTEGSTEYERWKKRVAGFSVLSLVSILLAVLAYSLPQHVEWNDSEFELYCFTRLKARPFAQVFPYVPIVLVSAGLLAILLKYILHKMDVLADYKDFTKWILPAVAVLAFIVMWTAFVVLMTLRRELGGITGVSFQEASWGFGQVLAVVAWLPTFMKAISQLIDWW